MALAQWYLYYVIENKVLIYVGPFCCTSFSKQPCSLVLIFVYLITKLVLQCNTGNIYVPSL